MSKINNFKFLVRRELFFVKYQIFLLRHEHREIYKNRKFNKGQHYIKYVHKRKILCKAGLSLARGYKFRARPVSILSTLQRSIMAMSQLDWNEPNSKRKSRKSSQRIREKSWAQPFFMYLLITSQVFPNCIFLSQSII